MYQISPYSYMKVWLVFQQGGCCTMRELTRNYMHGYVHRYGRDLLFCGVRFYWHFYG